jgi:ascorbate-specific PTS system EIIC-type component UlaA
MASDSQQVTGQRSETGGRPPKGLKVEAYVFYATASFFILSGIIYGFWTNATGVVAGPEMGGLVALLLTGLMLAMIATFLWFGSRRLEQARPEDDPDAAVADGAGDVGFFPAASYWPLALAAAAMLTAIAIAFWLVWLIVIGFGFLFLALTGWLFEFQRAHAAH